MTTGTALGALFIFQHLSVVQAQNQIFSRFYSSKVKYYRQLAEKAPAGRTTPGSWLVVTGSIRSTLLVGNWIAGVTHEPFAVYETFC